MSQTAAAGPLPSQHPTTHHGPATATTAIDVAEVERRLKAEGLSKANVRQCLKVIRELTEGRSARVGEHVFPPLDGVPLTWALVDEKLMDEARRWARVGRKRSRVEGVLYDKSNGWRLRHPLTKLLKLKRQLR